MLYLKTPWCPTTLMGIVWNSETFPCERLLQKTSHAELYESIIQNTTVVIKRYSKLMEHVQLPYIIHEIDIHSRLYCPHIVQLYGAFETKEYIYLIMETCRTDLREHLNYLMDIRSYPMNESHFVTEILIPLLLALQYLHNNHIIHRDIKPENILIDKDGKWKICDFGVSMNLYSNRASSLVGTLDYISPEVLNNRVVLTNNEKIDIWSVGILSCECISGKLLFDVSEESKRSLYADENQTELTSQIQTSIPATISENARDFLIACLHVNKERRWCVTSLLNHPWVKQNVKSKNQLRKLCCF
jgi:serine/threonine protein kinase